MSEGYQVICQWGELPDPGSRGFTLDTPEGPVDCFLVRRRGRVHAYRNSCPHTGAPMEWVRDQFLDLDCRFIQCALHGALFEPDTGECLRGPCLGQHLEAVEVVVQDGLVLGR